MGLSPTIRRSILLLIGSARNTSAAFMAASVYSNVLTFDPSETMPPSTTAIDPRAASRIDPNRGEHRHERHFDTVGDCRLGDQNDHSASFGDRGELLELRFDP
jgi:hypothetical protein